MQRPTRCRKFVVALSMTPQAARGWTPAFENLLAAYGLSDYQ